MREVTVRNLHFALDLAHAGAIDGAALIEGLPSLDPDQSAAAGWVDWGDWIELWERLERALGGPEGFMRTLRLAFPTALPEFRAFAAVFVSPVSLFTFLIVRHMRTSFRNVTAEVLEHLDDGRTRWRQTIAEPHRASEAFHRGTRALVTLLPMHLDLAESDTEFTLLTPRTAEYISRFPVPPPLATRGRRALSVVTSLAAAQLDEAFALVAERLGDGTPRASGLPTSAAPGWAEKLGLSPRQREVFALVIVGRSNKEIASALRGSERTVEFHVGRIFRAARVASRAELLAKVLGTPS